MPTIKAWSKRESHYEPPAIHEDRGRSRIEPPLDGRSDDPRLLAWMAGEYDYISEDS